MKTDKLIIAMRILAIVAISCAVLTAWYMVTYHINTTTSWNRCTEQTTAYLQHTTEYVNYHTAYAYEPSTNIAVCEYAFKVGNRTYAINIGHLSDIDYDIQKTIDVRYNPDNPNDYYYKLSDGTDWIHSKNDEPALF